MPAFLDVQLQGSGTVRLEDGSVTNGSISASADIARSKMAQEINAKYIVPLHSLRVWDNLAAILPNPSAADDIGFPATVTFGTISPYLDTRDLKTLSTSLYARGMFSLPPEYDDGQTVTVRIRAGALTTVADTSLVVDLELYEVDTNGGVGSDLCATAAQSINNLTLANKDFTITATNLVRGDILDFRITVTVVDSATGTAVKAKITEIAFLLDIRG